MLHYFVYCVRPRFVYCSELAVTAKILCIVRSKALCQSFILDYIVLDGQSCYSPESCVYADVFANYNKRVRPASEPEEVIHINVSVTVTSLTGIVSNATHITIAIFAQALRGYWRGREGAGLRRQKMLVV